MKNKKKFILSIILVILIQMLLLFAFSQNIDQANDSNYMHIDEYIKFTNSIEGMFGSMVKLASLVISIVGFFFGLNFFKQRESMKNHEKEYKLIEEKANNADKKIKKVENNTSKLLGDLGKVNRRIRDIKITTINNRFLRKDYHGVVNFFQNIDIDTVDKKDRIEILDMYIKSRINLAYDNDKDREEFKEILSEILENYNKLFITNENNNSNDSLKEKVLKAIVKKKVTDKDPSELRLISQPELRLISQPELRLISQLLYSIYESQILYTSNDGIKYIGFINNIMNQIRENGKIVENKKTEILSISFFLTDLIRDLIQCDMPDSIKDNIDKRILNEYLVDFVKKSEEILENHKNDIDEEVFKRIYFYNNMFIIYGYLEEKSSQNNEFEEKREEYENKLKNDSWYYSSFNLAEYYEKNQEVDSAIKYYRRIDENIDFFKEKNIGKRINLNEVLSGDKKKIEENFNKKIDEIINECIHELISNIESTDPIKAYIDKYYAKLVKNIKDIIVDNLGESLSKFNNKAGEKIISELILLVLMELVKRMDLSNYYSQRKKLVKIIDELKKHTGFDVFKSALNLFYIGEAYESLYYVSDSDPNSEEENWYSKANEYYEDSLKIDPFFIPSIINKLSIGFLKEKKFIDTKMKYDQAIKKIEENPCSKEKLYLLFNERGSFYFELGDYDSAFNDFKKSIELNSNNVTAYNYLGRIYELRGDVKKAEKHYFDLAIECYDNSKNDIVSIWPLQNYCNLKQLEKYKEVDMMFNIEKNSFDSIDQVNKSLNQDLVKVFEKISKPIKMESTREIIVILRILYPFKNDIESIVNIIDSNTGLRDSFFKESGMSRDDLIGLLKWSKRHKFKDSKEYNSKTIDLKPIIYDEILKNSNFFVEERAKRTEIFKENYENWLDRLYKKAIDNHRNAIEIKYLELRREIFKYKNSRIAVTHEILSDVIKRKYLEKFLSAIEDLINKEEKNVDEVSEKLIEKIIQMECTNAEDSKDDTDSIFGFKSIPIYTRDYYYLAKYFWELYKLEENYSYLSGVLKKKDDNNGVDQQESGKFDKNNVLSILVRTIEYILEGLFKINNNHLDGRLLEVELNESSYFYWSESNNCHKKSERVNRKRILIDLNRIINNFPSCDTAYKEIGDIYSLMGDYDLAISYYNKSENIYGGSYSLFNRRGNLYFDVNNYKRAESDYKRSILRYKNYLWPQVSLIKMYQYSMQTAKLKKEVVNILKKFKENEIKRSDIKILLTLSRVVIDSNLNFSSNKDLDDALVEIINKISSILEEQPSCISFNGLKKVKIVLELSKVLENIKKYKIFPNEDFLIYQYMRLKIFKKYDLKIETKDINYTNICDDVEHILKSIESKELKKYRITKFKTIRRLISYEKTYFYGVKNSYKNIISSETLENYKGNNGKIYELVKQLINPSNIDENIIYISDYFEIGVIYFLCDKYDLAIEILNKALEKNNRDHKCLTYRGLCYIKKGNLDFAMIDLKKSYEINNYYYRTHAALGLLRLYQIDNNNNVTLIGYLNKHIHDYLTHLPVIKYHNELDNILKFKEKGNYYEKIKEEGKNSGYLIALLDRG